MFRSAGFLLIIGLAIGLFLGFNPQAHQATIQKWDSARSSYLKFMANATAKVQGLNSHITSTAQSGSRVTNQPQTSVSSSWNQVSTAFENLWASVQKFFANVTAKINSAR